MSWLLIALYFSTGSLTSELLISVALHNAALLTAEYFRFPHRIQRTLLHLYFLLPLNRFPTKIKCLLIHDSILLSVQTNSRCVWFVAFTAVSLVRSDFFPSLTFIFKNGGI